jgi:hypothetical protein
VYTEAIVFCVAVGLFCLFMAFRKLKRKRLLDDVPTSKVHGVFIGLTELKGTAETDTPLASHLTGAICVFYAWYVDEQWSRVVTETYTDSEGNTQTRTRVETGWTRVAGSRTSNPFYLQDDTGVIRVLPDGANVTGNTVMNQTCTPANPLYYGMGPPGAIPDSTHFRRFVENVIPLHASLFVMGQARERQDIVAAEIARDKNAVMYLISTRTEEQVKRSFTRGFWGWLAGGLASVVFIIWAWYMVAPSYDPVDWGTVALGVAIYLLAASLGWVWTVYNSLINLKHMMERGWSQVDIQLKRRHDLIPNLVAAVSGYRDYESEVQEMISRIRAQNETSTPGELHGISSELAAIVERYPELKAEALFLKLQSELAGTENRIALARDYFNSIVAFYNTRLEVIPDRFVAVIAGLRPRALFTAANFERAPVTVNLAD